MGYLFPTGAYDGAACVERCEEFAIIGDPEPDETPRHTPAEAARAVCALLAARGTGTTICPSEAARDLVGPGGDWRAAMPCVHDAVDALMAGGEVVLSWQGANLARRAGPYRIARKLR